MRVQEVLVGAFPVVGSLLIIKKLQGGIEATFQFALDAPLCRFPVLQVVALCRLSVCLITIPTLGLLLSSFMNG